MGSDGRKDLVLGLAEDYEWSNVRVFVDSLQRTPFRGELRLFVAGNSEETMVRLRERRVQTESYRRLRLVRGDRVFHAHDPPLQRYESKRVARFYPALTRGLTVLARDRPAVRARIATPISLPSVSRYFRYYRYLARNVERYRNVMVTDVRDVYFQHDPFAFDVGDHVHCFLEHEGTTLGNQRHNREWLQWAYGLEVARALADEQASCSGTTIGSARAMLGYLRAMTEQLVALPQFDGIDQPAHNYLIYTGRLPNVKLGKNGESAVATLSLVPKEDVIRALPHGLDHINVFHQYDRHPPLTELLLARLA